MGSQKLQTQPRVRSAKPAASRPVVFWDGRLADRSHCPQKIPRSAVAIAGTVGEHSLGVPGALVEGSGQQDAVQEGRDVRPGLQVARHPARRRHEPHHRGEAGEADGRQGGEPPPAQPQERRAGRQVDHPDPLQDAGKPERSEIQERPRRQEEAEPDQDGAPAQDPEEQPSAPGAGFDPPAEREGDRHPDDEQEEREDEVGRRPAVPGRVEERRIDVGPASRVVHQDHPGDRRAAEGVEGAQPVRQGRHGFRSASIASRRSSRS